MKTAESLLEWALDSNTKEKEMKKIIFIIIILMVFSVVTYSESLEERLTSPNKWIWIGVTTAENPDCCDFMKEGCYFKFYEDSILEVVDNSGRMDRGYWRVEKDVIVTRLDSDDDELRYTVRYFEKNICLTLTEDNYLGLEPYCIYLTPET